MNDNEVKEVVGGEPIKLNGKEKLALQKLYVERLALGKKKAQLSDLYSDTMSAADRLLTNRREVVNTLKKNSKEFKLFWAKLGKKTGIDFLAVNYDIDYENGVLTPSQNQVMDEAVESSQKEDLDTEEVSIEL